MIAAVALHLWQSTLVLIAAWVLARACRRNSAAIRYCIWFGASLKFLVPFALLQRVGEHIGRTLPEPLQVDPSLIETSKALFVPSVSPLVDDLPQLQLAIGVVWALGALAVLVQWLREWQLVRLRVAFALPVSIPLPIPVRVTADDLPPGVVGILRPVMLLPRAVLEELSEAQLQALLAHEIGHFERRDNLTAAVHKCVEAIFWFHPLVWWLGARLMRERETACDESVIEEGHGRTQYAEAILYVCRLGVPRPIAGLAASTGGDLRQRICAIMTGERTSMIGPARCALMLASVLAVCETPIAAGIIAGADQEASAYGPIAFDDVTLGPATSGAWPSAHVDMDGQRIALRNVSVRELIRRAYPSSLLYSESAFINRTYDIDARWHGEHGTSERNVYRELLRRVLRTNSNLELYVRHKREM